MIYTLTLNASLDYLAFTDSVNPGEIHKINEYELYPGGKGINVSQVLSSLGIDNVALGYVAGVTGESLCQLLEEKSIKQDFIKLSHGMTRINVKMRHEDIETDFNAVGPLVDSDEIEQLIKKLLYLNEDDILIISGSFPKGIGEQEFEKILDVIVERKIRLVADVTGDYLHSALKRKPFLVKPNEFEAAKLLGYAIDSVEQAGKATTDIASLGAMNVLISLGEKGAVLRTSRGEVIYMPSLQGEAVNTVGAGDSMVAGFVAGYCQSEDFEHALKMAVSAGAATAFSKGLATGSEIMRLFNNGLFR